MPNTKYIDQGNEPELYETVGRSPECSRLEGMLTSIREAGDALMTASDHVGESSSNFNRAYDNAAQIYTALVKKCAKLENSEEAGELYTRVEKGLGRLVSKLAPVRLRSAWAAVETAKEAYDAAVSLKDINLETGNAAEVAKYDRDLETLKEKLGESSVRFSRVVARDSCRYSNETVAQIKEEKPELYRALLAEWQNTDYEPRFEDPGAPELVDPELGEVTLGANTCVGKYRLQDIIKEAIADRIRIEEEAGRQFDWYDLGQEAKVVKV